MGGDHLNYVIKSRYYCFHIDCCYFVCLALVAIATATVDKLVTSTWDCFTEKTEKMLNQSNDSTETMYTKLGRKRVSPGCKNCLTGDGTYFFGSPKVFKR